MRCSREYAHEGPHSYHAVGVAEVQTCPGRGRMPLRALRMWASLLLPKRWR